MDPYTVGRPGANPGLSVKKGKPKEEHDFEPHTTATKDKEGWTKLRQRPLARDTDDEWTNVDLVSHPASAYSSQIDMWKDREHFPSHPLYTINSA